MDPSNQPELVCLLLARNAEADLDGFFAAISGIVDTVVALDRSSTDRTRERLEAEPLVVSVISGEGTDRDPARDRDALLAAAAALQPRWVLRLAADERIAPDDQAALRELLTEQTDPKYVYLFRVLGVAGDSGRVVDGPERWGARLFAWAPRQTLAVTDQDCGPAEIDTERQRRTTVRIQRRAAPGERGERPWAPRPPELPALVNGPSPPAGPVAPGAPVLSAVVISRDDGPRIEQAVASVVAQVCPVPFEVIVVVSGSGGAGAFVRERFPEVRVVELDHPALPGEARNAGVRVARGRYVSFPGSHVELAPGSLAARVCAHELGWAMVSGVMLNGTRTAAGWASYYLDNATVLPGRPSGPHRRAPIRCSYLRAAIEAVGGFPEDVRAAEDTAVNLQLFALGYGAYRSQEVRLYHNSRCRTVPRLVGHHFGRGRAFGRILFDGAVNHGRWYKIRRFVLGGPNIRFKQVRHDVARWAPEQRGHFRRVSPLVFLAATSTWAGWCSELLVLLPRAALSTAIRRSAAAARRQFVRDEPDRPASRTTRTDSST
jgi:glycosyltransferase involved in cell wall biosynthesis